MANQLILTTDDEGYDILVNTGEEPVVLNSGEVGQFIKQRLLHFEGEWFLNTPDGTPWLQKIFVRPADKVQADIIIKRRILETTGAVSILSYNSVFDRATRRLRVNFNYTDVFVTGAQSLSVEITP